VVKLSDEDIAEFEVPDVAMAITFLLSGCTLAPTGEYH